MEAQDSIRRLEEQLRQVQKSKVELENKQNELEEMLKKLENDKAMEAEEKQRLVSLIKSFVFEFNCKSRFSLVFLYI